jgi:hypothetical protein
LQPLNAGSNTQKFSSQGSASQRQFDPLKVVQAVQEENKNLSKPQQQVTPIQQANQKSLNPNPFKQRPVSHLVPSKSKLPTLKDQQVKA